MNKVGSHAMLHDVNHKTVQQLISAAHAAAAGSRRSLDSSAGWMRDNNPRRSLGENPAIATAR